MEGRNKDYDSRWTVKQVTALCAAAPRLKSFVVDVRGTWNVEMEDLLRNKPPFTSVSACTLSLSFPGPEDHGDVRCLSFFFYKLLTPFVGWMTNFSTAICSTTLSRTMLRCHPDQVSSLNPSHQAWRRTEAAHGNYLWTSQR